MSYDWVDDITEMHSTYHVYDWIDHPDNADKLKEYLKFRIGFLREELEETEAAFEANDAEEVVDGLIDLCVVAIGTLDTMGVRANVAWDEVLRANMEKEVGQKATRPNKLGLPDLVKPTGWVGPSHKGNHGLLDKVLK